MLDRIGWKWFQAVQMGQRGLNGLTKFKLDLIGSDGFILGQGKSNLWKLAPTGRIRLNR